MRALQGRGRRQYKWYGKAAQRRQNHSETVSYSSSLARVELASLISFDISMACSTEVS